MAAPHMTSKIRKALKEYIDNIPTDNLEQFVKVPDTQPGRLNTNYDFESRDFHLAFLGEKAGEPEGCWYFEVRGSPTSDHSAIRQLAAKSSKYHQSQRRFAHVEFNENVMSWFFAHHVRHAIALSPAWAAGRINKVRVSRRPGVEFEEPEKPEDGDKPYSYRKGNRDDVNPLDAFVYEIIPFPGFDEEGQRVEPAKQKGKKSPGEGSSKPSGKGSKK